MPWYVFNLNDHRISDQTILAAAANLPNLQCFSVKANFKLSDNAVSEIVRNCPKLKYLSLAKCGNLTERVFLEISSLALLCHLEIPYCQGINLFFHFFSSNFANFANFSGITDSALQQISIKCTQLKKLNIANCTRLSFPNVIEAPKMCMNLESLHIPVIPGITFSSLNSLLQCCLHLTELVVRGCCYTDVNKLKICYPHLVVVS